jgi:hypothetical protein
MLLSLDHLVVAVMDPDAAAGELERTVGLRCTGGGRHPLWGTWNRLAWLGDTYVELIGVFDRSLAPNGAVSRIVSEAIDRGHVGLVSFAVASDSLDQDLAGLRGTGSTLGDVEVRSRTRPDGEVVTWGASFPPVLGPAEPPFVIEHELVGAEWGDEARSARAAYEHPLGGTARMATLDLPVPDVPAVAAAYRMATGIELTETTSDGTVVAVGRVGSQAVRLRAGRPHVDPAVIEINVGAGSPDATPPPAGLREVDALGVRWRVRA